MPVSIKPGTHKSILKVTGAQRNAEDLLSDDIFEDKELEQAALMVQRAMRMKWARRDLKIRREAEPRTTVKAFFTYIDKEIEDAANCKALFFTVILIFSFINFANGFLRSQLSFAIGD